MELQVIQSKIYEIRGQRVMLDRDLAEMYNVETLVLSQVVKHNMQRFPEDFIFQLTDEEFQNWKSQVVMTNSNTDFVVKQKLAAIQRFIKAQRIIPVVIFRLTFL